MSARPTTAAAAFTPEEVAKKKAFYNFKRQDPQAREREGHSVFYKDDSGGVFHTYSCYDRGNDMLNIHYHYLDMVPRGRDEGGRANTRCQTPWRFYHGV